VPAPTPQTRSAHAPWRTPTDLAAAPPLPSLSALRLEACRLRGGARQLAALARSTPRLGSLRLARVVGLSDEGLAALATLQELSELAVVAPHNRWGFRGVRAQERGAYSEWGTLWRAPTC
jgi:hypothetical protein